MHEAGCTLARAVLFSLDLCALGAFLLLVWRGHPLQQTCHFAFERRDAEFFSRDALIRVIQAAFLIQAKAWACIEERIESASQKALLTVESAVIKQGFVEKVAHQPAHQREFFNEWSLCSRWFHACIKNAQAFPCRAGDTMRDNKKPAGRGF